MEKIYIFIHEDTGQAMKAWFPDFPGLTVPGDRLSDTLTIAPLVLQEHVDEMKQRGERLPEAITPDPWEIHTKHPSALIGLAKVTITED